MSSPAAVPKVTQSELSLSLISITCPEAGIDFGFELELPELVSLFYPIAYETITEQTNIYI